MDLNDRPCVDFVMKFKIIEDCIYGYYSHWEYNAYFPGSSYGVS